jgi:hypothetical protein
MPSKIERLCSVTDVIAVTASEATSKRIPFAAASGAMMFVEDVSGGATAISWYVAAGPESAPVQANDGTSNVTTQVIAGRAYPLPDALFAAPFIVAVTDTGTASVRLSVKG